MVYLCRTRNTRVSSFHPLNDPSGLSWCGHLPVLEIWRPKLREVQQLAQDLTASDWGTEMLIWVSLTPEAPLPPGTELSAEGGRQALSRTCRMEFQPYGISRLKGHTALDPKARAWDHWELSLAKRT